MIASKYAEAFVLTNQSMCDYCQSQKKPMQFNSATASLAWNFLRQNDSIEMPKHQPIKDALTEREVLPNHGPGTELKKLISWFYSPDKRKCKCKTRIQKMNLWGPDKCEQRMETILRWLKHSAKIAKIPFFRPIAMKLVQTAINRSRLKIAQSRLPLLRVKTAP